MSEFGERVRNNKLTLEEAVPTSQGWDAIWIIGVLLVAFVALSCAIVVVNPPLLSWKGLLLESGVTVVGLALTLFLLDRHGSAYRRQWWYCNFLGCYAFYGLDIDGAMTVRYGRDIDDAKENFAEFRNNFVVLAVHLGGWFRPRRVIEIRRMTLFPEWWRMKRANKEGTRLRIDDLDTESGERGRIYTHVDTFFSAIQARYLHCAVRAGTWHNSLLAWLLPAKQQRDALEALVFHMIREIGDTTRLFHSIEAKETRLNALRKLSQILPTDDPQQRSIAEQIPEAEADLKAAREKAAKGKKGSGVTVRKEAKGVYQESS